MADVLLEVLSPLTLGTTANGEDSSFELCAAAFLKDKEARENGVGIRSLIVAAWSRARGGSHGHRLYTPRAQTSSPRLPDSCLPAARRQSVEGRSRAYIIIDGDTEWDTHWHPHDAHPHARRHGRSNDARSPLTREPITRQSAC